MSRGERGMETPHEPRGNILSTMTNHTSIQTMDHTLFDILTFWINGVLSLVLVIIGTLGNAAVVVSLHCFRSKSARKKRRQAFYFYLMTFAVWNTGLLIATVLFNCVPVLLQWNPDAQIFSQISYFVGYALGNCCLTANVWLAVVVTLERFLAVSLPFHSTRLTSPRRRAKLVSVILSLAAIIYNCPLLFELTWDQHYAYQHTNIQNDDSLENRTNHSQDMEMWSDLVPPLYELRMSNMRDNVYYQFVYRVLGNMLFVSGIPFLVILLLTVKIVCVVRESDRRRAYFVRQYSNSERNSSVISIRSGPSINTQSTSWRHAHVVLTLIAAKFLLCYSLPLVVNIVEVTIDKRKYESENSDWSRALKILVDLSNLLIVLDGATNAFFYFSWWKSRIHLKGRFQRRKGVTEANTTDFQGTVINECTRELLRKHVFMPGLNSEPPPVPMVMRKLAVHLSNVIAQENESCAQSDGIL